MNYCPKRFYSLDVLRGVAALSVALWHWQHFFYQGVLPGAFRPECQPLYAILFLFYREGHRAVDLFFSLSGFVFFWLYSGPITHRTVTGSRFFWLRFSRLYPLHIFTLFMVAGLQILLVKWAGTELVYSWNDLYHFTLNIFFASAWGLERGASFNGPIWSVSVEVVLYALFFLFCRRVPLKPYFVVAAVAAGALLERVGSPNIGRGVFAFFVGGCVYLLYERAQKAELRYHVARVSLLVTAIVWGATIIHLSDVGAKHFYLLRIITKNGNFWAGLILFPITIFTLALLEKELEPFSSRLSFVGDLTYSSYLLHFPLQLLFILAVRLLQVDGDVFYSTGMLALYFAILIPLSLGAYRFFELPLQRFMRQRVGS